MKKRKKIKMYFCRSFVSDGWWGEWLSERINVKSGIWSWPWWHECLHQKMLVAPSWSGKNVVHDLREMAMAMVAAAASLWVNYNFFLNFSRFALHMAKKNFTSTAASNPNENDKQLLNGNWVESLKQTTKDDDDDTSSSTDISKGKIACWLIFPI